MAKCIACGLCAEKCPKKVPDEYNLGLAKRKAAYLSYAQAVPPKYAIDKETCLYFKKGGKCKACEKFCPTGAVDFSQVDEDKDDQRGRGHPGPRLQALRSQQLRRLSLRQSSQRDHRHGVRAHPGRGRTLFGPPGQAFGPQGAHQDRLAPVRRLPGSQSLRQQLLLGGVLHVCHQGGDHRQGAQQGAPGCRHLLHGYAHPRQGVRKVLLAGPG